MEILEMENLLEQELTKPFVGKAKCVPAEPERMLLPFQQRWVLDGAKMKLAEKSRQIGWTWATAYRVVYWKSRVGSQYDSWITSRDETQAKLFLEDCVAWARLADLGAENEGMQVIDHTGTTSYVLRFANNLRVHSMSSNPDAQAGKRGHRVLDEFALHADPRKLYTTAQPGTLWGGQMEIFSTHRGSNSFFNQLINEVRHQGNPKKFSLHSVTLQQALEEGLLYKLQTKASPDDPVQELDEAAYFDSLRAACADEESFLQEYACQPGDEQSAFLGYELIAGCEYQSHEKDWGYTVANGGLSLPARWNEATPDANSVRLYVGVDVGREHDLTVIWVVEKLGQTAYTRAVITMEKETFDAQEHVLYEWLALPQVARCCIDQSGIGRQFTERAQQRFGKYRVEGINFTNAAKEELAYPVRAAFEDRLVRIPNQPLIRSDLRAIRKEMTASNNVRFTADRGKNGHADRFWGLALALHAAKTRDDGVWGAVA